MAGSSFVFNLFFDNIYEESYQNENTPLQAGENLLLEAILEKLPPKHQ